MLKIQPYDPRWKDLFKEEKILIQENIGMAYPLYHIGSTSVEGLPAKPIIDMILSVPCLVDFDPKPLVSCGYEDRGEMVIPFRRVFQKKALTGERTHFVHVFEEGDPQIQRNLSFQKHLRENSSSLKAYAILKQNLVQEFGGEKSFWNYTKKKSDFIESCLRKEKFNSLVFNRAYSDSEWEAFHNLHKAFLLQERKDFPKQPEKDEILSNTSSCFILTLEGKVIGAFWALHEKDTVFIRTFCTKAAEPVPSYALFMIEKWAAYRGASFLQTKIGEKPKSLRPLKELVGFTPTK